MRSITKDDIMQGTIKAYVNRNEESVKVVINDEFEIMVRNTTYGIAAKKLISRGGFDLKDVKPFHEDDNTKLIKQELKRLSEKIGSIYETAERLPGFFMYSKEVERKTDKIAYEIINIQTNGI
ncbi:hypothetical protein [Bacillus amyloliquefaciens]|uniref:hypothetical protein n=1 Tax=Bacillus amyloliquefaciens TaxID=1390 RepID=UPI00280A4031|nr:hypothetical protein [Bacillus amyloliquefaciens]MDQ8094227.1 hypothetical protein [Bacillus amyloliquefaciens]